MAERRRPVEGVGVSAGLLARPPDPRHRRHRAARRLARAAAGRRAAPTWSACVRDWVPAERAGPRAALLAAGHASVRGDVRDQAAARAGARRVRDRHRLPPRRADDRRHRQPRTRSPPSRRTSSGTWALLEACRRSPAREASRRRVVRQGVRRPGAAALRRRTRRSQGTHPYDVSKSCADLIAQRLRGDVRAAGGDHPLRQLLRRRRPQLEPDRPRHDPLGAARASVR